MFRRPFEFHRIGVNVLYCTKERMRHEYEYIKKDGPQENGRSGTVNLKIGKPVGVYFTDDRFIDELNGGLLGSVKTTKTVF